MSIPSYPPNPMVNPFDRGNNINKKINKKKKQGMVSNC